LQFCKDNTSFEMKERENERRRKIIVGAPSCPCSWYMSPHRTRSGAPLRTPSLKATNGHQEASHALLKGVRLQAPPTYWHMPTTFFMIYKKTIKPLTPHNNCKKKKKTRSKNQKYPFILGKKKLTSRTMR
jgi:hypothetical protein